MITKFTSTTFLVIATLATESAIKHSSLFTETGKFPVTDPTFWYQEAVRFLLDNPSVEDALANFSEKILLENEARMVFKTCFASACAAYFTAKKGGLTHTLTRKKLNTGTAFKLGAWLVCKPWDERR